MNKAKLRWRHLLFSKNLKLSTNKSNSESKLVSHRQKNLRLPLDLLKSLLNFYSDANESAQPNLIH